MQPALKSLLSRFATLTALCLMVIGMGGASCLSIVFDPDEPAPESTDAGNDDEETTCGDGAICTPGCSSDAIDSNGNEICAQCETDEGNFEVCGDVVTLPCFTVESPFGGECQQCFSEDGAFSFDNCDESQDQIVEVQCREVDVEIDGEDGEPSVQSCEICTDEAGRVVSRRCRPDADTCSVVVENGLECEVCTLNGEFAYRECVPMQIEPRVCETYGNENSRCLDCYGADDELLLHICASGEEISQGQIECDGYVNFDGEFCERCFNTQTGEVVEEFCEDGSPPDERCERLFFDNAECTVCTLDGELVSSECDGFCRDDPNDPDGFVSPDCPAQCEPSRIEDNVVCFSCFDEDTGNFEEQCTSGDETDLLCEVVYVTEDPTNPEDPEAAPPPQECNGDEDCEDGQYCNDRVCLNDNDEPPVLAAFECLVCLDPATLDEVYRDCQPVGGPNQPECYVEETLDGLPCEICFDPDTQEVFFDSCSEEPPPPPPEQCLEFESFLYGEDGDILLFDEANGNEPLEVIAQCQQCEGDGFEDGFEECNLYRYCEANDCDLNLVHVQLVAPACNLPWGDLFSGSSEELGRIMGWTLGDLQIDAVEVVRLGRAENLSCDENDSCSCERGDTIVLAVSESGAQELAAFGFEFVDDANVP